MTIALILFLLMVLTALEIWFLWPFLRRKGAEARLLRVCQAQRAIVLSFDDGPGAHVTPDILDLLQRHGAKATFYLLGCNGALHPELVARIAAEGHDVGTHTQNHTNAWKVAPDTAATDIRQGIATLVPLGANENLFRPPFGKQTFATMRLAQRLGLRVGWWTHDSGDTSAFLPDPDSVLDALRTSGGGVVLMHDMDRPAADRARSDYTRNLTARILDMAQAEGFSILPLSAVDRGY